jgi:hypothetical protein
MDDVMVPKDTNRAVARLYLSKSVLSQPVLSNLNHFSTKPLKSLSVLPENTLSMDLVFEKCFGPVLLE